MPQTVTITCHPVSESGSLEAHLSVNVDLKQPTFAEKVALNNIPLPALNSFIAKYLSVYAKDGYFSFRSEMVSKEGSYDGYMKPFFKDLEFEPMPKDRGVELPRFGPASSMVSRVSLKMMKRKRWPRRYPSTASTRIPAYRHLVRSVWRAAERVVRCAGTEVQLAFSCPGWQAAGAAEAG